MYVCMHAFACVCVVLCISVVLCSFVSLGKQKYMCLRSGQWLFIKCYKYVFLQTCLLSTFFLKNRTWLSSPDDWESKMLRRLGGCAALDGRFMTTRAHLSTSHSFWAQTAGHMRKFLCCFHKRCCSEIEQTYNMSIHGGGVQENPTNFDHPSKQHDGHFKTTVLNIPIHVTNLLLQKHVPVWGINDPYGLGKYPMVPVFLIWGCQKTRSVPIIHPNYFGVCFKVGLFTKT